MSTQKNRSMPSLAEYQTQLAAALRGADDARSLFRQGVFAIEDGLDIYRGNVAAAAANALRLTFPTVDRLVGEAYFNQLCAKRLQLDPPKSGSLADYCTQFPQFLQAVEHLHHLPYLADIARFDLALERTANADRRARSIRLALDEHTVLVLEPTLTCLTLHHPADEIRSAIEADEEALSRIDMSRRARRRAIWRGANGVELRPLSEGSGLFLSAILNGRGLDHALAKAAHAGGEAVALDIERDIMRAPFTRILAATD